jgi:hypothetical protein
MHPLTYPLRYPLHNNQDLVVRLPGLLGNEELGSAFTMTVIPLLRPFFVLELEVMIEEGGVGCHCYWLVQGELQLKVRARQPGDQDATTHTQDPSSHAQAERGGAKTAQHATGAGDASSQDAPVAVGTVAPNGRSGGSRSSLECEQQQWRSDSVGYSFVGDGSVAPCSATASLYAQMVSLTKTDVALLAFDWPGILITLTILTTLHIHRTHHTHHPNYTHHLTLPRLPEGIGRAGGKAEGRVRCV